MVVGMTLGVFVWPMLAVAALLVFALIPRKGRGNPGGRGDLGSVPAGYARTVRASFGVAADAAGLKPPKDRDPISIGPGRQISADGVEFPATWGGYKFADLRQKEEALAGALQKYAKVGTLRWRETPGAPGVGSLIISRVHPLAAPAVWPAAPGRLPPGSDGRGMSVAVGRTEFLRPARIDLAKNTGWFGQNGSGKTVGIIDMMMGAAALPFVEMTVYDGSVKRGSGYVEFGPRLRHGQVLKGRKGIMEDVRRVEASLRRRSEILAGNAWVPTPELPLRMIVMEEFPALVAEDDDLEAMIHLAQQGREIGLVVHLVAQNAQGAVVDSILRSELRQRIAFRVADYHGADTALGAGVRGIDESSWTPIPEAWPGVYDSVVVEESGVVRSRAFLPAAPMSDTHQWAKRVGFAAEDPDWWNVPRLLTLARMRAFVDQHVRACPRAPQAIDFAPKLRANTQRKGAVRR